MKNKKRKVLFAFKNFDITLREVIASLTIIAVMILIGFPIADRIRENEMDQNEIYNKAIKIQSQELFRHGMDTNVGNAFVYGDLIAVDTVTFPEIGGDYIYVHKAEEWYERHEEWVTETDSNGKETKRKKVWYEWETKDSETKHSEKIKFCGIEFPYEKIDLNMSSSYITTIKGDRKWSWSSGEFVKVRFKYYGISTKHTGTIFTDLRNETMSNESNFYDEKTIEETVDYLQTNGGDIIFWFAWIILICVLACGFFYIDNRWLE